MFGPRLSSIFKSRWMALLWAAMVIWTAVDFVGVSHPASGNGGNGTSSSDENEPMSQEDAAAMKHWLDGK
jgi:hypothetical protein